MKISLESNKGISLKKGNLALASKKEVNLIPFLKIKELENELKTGLFFEYNKENLFQISSISSLAGEDKIIFLKALTDIDFKEKTLTFNLIQRGFSAACVTLSDKASQGLRTDESGVVMEKIISENFDISLQKKMIIADEKTKIRKAFFQLIYNDKIDLIITSGGTGVTPRDITPDVTLEFIEKRLYGFEQLMMNAAMQKTPHAAISRAVAGIADETLIINLPGSPKAVKENLEAVIEPISHTIKKAQGDKTDCAVQKKE